MPEDPYDPAGSTNARSAIRAARVRFPIDASSVRELNREFGRLKDNLRDIHNHLRNIQRVAPGLTGLGGSAGGDGGYLAHMAQPLQQRKTGQDTAPTNNDSVSQRASTMQSFLQGAFNVGPGAGGGTGAGAKAGGAAANAALIGQIVSQIGGAIGNAINARVEKGYAYSLSADKMNMMYQQMTGMSQLQVQSNYRQPLTNYRLGPTGINDLMGMQASTGISALGQASSVDAIRSLSGYGYSTADAVNMIQGLGSAPTANRMMMMMGGGLYGPGGKENSAFSVIQKTASRMGLTGNKALAESALRQGSITRQRMSFMGIDSSMQDTIIQYGLSQQQFAAKGGTGMYDPANRSHRGLMGVEDTFASEVEDTTMTKVRREEQFYRNQVDNFADLERQTQSLTRMFAGLEKQLQGILGGKISNNPVTSMVGSVGSGVGMGLITAGGAVSVASGGPGAVVGVPMMAVGVALLGLSKMAGGSGNSGDAPVTRTSGPSRTTGGPSGTHSNMSGMDPNMRVPTYNGSTTVGALMNSQTFQRLHPTMKSRALKVIKEGRGTIGIGEGYRSPDQQKAMFLQRYKRTERNTGLFWDGSYWEHVSGAMAAPPGMSFHQVGLAIDFVYQDVNTFHSLAAKHGLKIDVPGEPWHAQPKELPTSWREYVDGGMSWGKPEGASLEDQRKSTRIPAGGGHAYHGMAGSGPSGEVDTYFGLTLSQMVAANSSEVLGGGSFQSPTGVSGSAPSFVEEGSPTSTRSLSGILSGKEIVRLLQSRGRLRGDDLVKGVAISHRESGWNSRAHNPNRATGDDSYGLFQINMIEPNGSWLRPRLGISKNEELFDAYKNVDAMNYLKSDGVRRGDTWYHWGGYKGMAGNYGTDMAMAARTVQKYGRGDAPVFSGGGSAPSISSGASFNAKSISVTIAPNITVQGGGSASYDARRLAKELAPMIEREARAALMRSN